MGILVEKDNERSSLGERISADLRERISTSSLQNSSSPDLVEDSEYLKNTKHTSRSAWFWLVLVMLALGALAIMFIH